MFLIIIIARSNKHCRRKALAKTLGRIVASTKLRLDYTSQVLPYSDSPLFRHIPYSSETGAKCPESSPNLSYDSNRLRPQIRRTTHCAQP